MAKKGIERKPYFQEALTQGCSEYWLLSKVQ